MLIVQRLYIRDFLKVLLVLSVGVGLAFSCLELIDKIEDFMPHRPSPLQLAWYVLLAVPKYIHYLLPMAVLLSSLFVFSQAVGRKEIVAIKSSGGKLRTLLLPFVGLGVVITVCAFGLSEFVVPPAAKAGRSLKTLLAKKGKDVVFKEGSLYMRSRDGSIVRVGLYLPDQNVSKDITIFTFDLFRLKERIDARSASWEGHTWQLKDVTVTDIATGRLTTMASREYKGIESPKIFQEGLWKIEEATLSELLNYHRRLQEAGFRNTKFTVDISGRLSYPLVNLFMLLLGMSLATGDALQNFLASRLRLGAQTGNTLVAAGVGLLISVAYWFSYTFFLTLGYTGAIPPPIAPWVVPACFGGMTAFLYSTIPE